MSGLLVPDRAAARVGRALSPAAFAPAGATKRADRQAGRSTGLACAPRTRLPRSHLLFLVAGLATIAAALAAVVTAAALAVTWFAFVAPAAG